MVTLNSGIVALPDELPPGLDLDLIENMARLSCIGIPSGDVDIEVRPPCSKWIKWLKFLIGVQQNYFFMF